MISNIKLISDTPLLPPSNLPGRATYPLSSFPVARNNLFCRDSASKIAYPSHNLSKEVVMINDQPAFKFDSPISSIWSPENFDKIIYISAGHNLLINLNKSLTLRIFSKEHIHLAHSIPQNLSDFFSQFFTLIIASNSVFLIGNQEDLIANSSTIHELNNLDYIEISHSSAIKYCFIAGNGLFALSTENELIYWHCDEESNFSVIKKDVRSFTIDARNENLSLQTVEFVDGKYEIVFYDLVKNDGKKATIFDKEKLFLARNSNIELTNYFDESISSQKSLESYFTESLAPILLPQNFTVFPFENNILILDLAEKSFKIIDNLDTIIGISVSVEKEIYHFISFPAFPKKIKKNEEKNFNNFKIDVLKVEDFNSFEILSKMELKTYEISVEKTEKNKKIEKKSKNSEKTEKTSEKVEKAEIQTFQLKGKKSVEKSPKNPEKIQTSENFDLILKEEINKNMKILKEEFSAQIKGIGAQISLVLNRMESKFNDYIDSSIEKSIESKIGSELELIRKDLEDLKGFSIPFQNFNNSGIYENQEFGWNQENY